MPGISEATAGSRIGKLINPPGNGKHFSEDFIYEPFAAAYRVKTGPPRFPNAKRMGYMNLAHILEEVAHRLPEKRALIFREETYSYRRLNEQINKLANALKELGVEKGDRVAILLPNSPVPALSFYAGLKVGAIPICINPMVKGQELRTILANSQAKIFITHYDCFESLKPDRSEMPFLREIILTNPPEEMRGVRSLPRLMENGATQFPAIEVKPEDPAIIVYTSGTTGKPKGAVFTHGCLLGRVHMVRFDLEEPGEEDRMLTVAPLSSSMGISGVMISAFLNGATVYLHERFDPEEYVKTIRREKITVIRTVLTVYFEINGLPNIGKEDFQSLRFAGSSGAFLPSEVRRRFAEISGVEIIQYYGCTEAGRPLARDPAAKNKRKFRSVGQVLPDVEIKIVSPEGRRMPPGKVGEVCFRFPGQMTGYWNLPEESKETLKDGWVHSGDIGKLDPKGFLYLQDRKADRMIVGGYNVYPTEIENVLHQDPRIAEAAVIGVPDERLGEIPMAFVVLRKGLKATEEDLINLTREKLAKYKALRKVRLVGNIPKNPIGKMLKKVLRNQYLSEEKPVGGERKSSGVSRKGQS